MKNLMLVIITLIGVAVLGCKTKSKQKVHKKRTENKITCDTFKIKARRRFNKELISIKTDLPNDTKIHLAANRIYQVKGKSTEKMLSYFSKSTTVGKWKKPRNIKLNNKEWKKKLRERQKKLMKIGDANKLNSINYNVRISAVVSSDQFGKHNANLMGKAVNENKTHSVDDKTEVYYPIDYFAKSSQNSKSKTSPYILVTKDVNIHLKSNLNSTVVGQAQKGDIFTLDKKTKKWYRIFMFSGEYRYIQGTAARGTNTSPVLPSSASKACKKILNAQDRSSQVAEKKYPNNIYKQIDYSRLLMDKYMMPIFHEDNIPPARYSKLEVICAKRLLNNYK